MIDIIFEDDSIVVVNKRSGVLVIPSPKNEQNTLTDGLNLYLKNKNEDCKAHPCHRLDRDTSGVIVYAKGKSNQKLIMDQFHNNQVTKSYIAIARGKILKENGTIDFKIENKEAITKYKVLKSNDSYTVVEVRLLTGRTNQIRIHFSQIGHPLLGETKFAFRKDFKIKLKHLALHSKKIEFIHPKSKEGVVFEADTPAYIEKFMV